MLQGKVKHVPVASNNHLEVCDNAFQYHSHCFQYVVAVAWADYKNYSLLLSSYMYISYKAYICVIVAPYVCELFTIYTSRRPVLSN